VSLKAGPKAHKIAALIVMQKYIIIIIEWMKEQSFFSLFVHEGMIARVRHKHKCKYEEVKTSLPKADLKNAKLFLLYFCRMAETNCSSVQCILFRHFREMFPSPTLIIGLILENEEKSFL